LGKYPKKSHFLGKYPRKSHFLGKYPKKNQLGTLPPTFFGKILKKSLRRQIFELVVRPVLFLYFLGFYNFRAWNGQMLVTALIYINIII
jgi:hypothetical protein